MVEVGRPLRWHPRCQTVVVVVVVVVRDGQSTDRRGRTSGEGLGEHMLLA